MSKTTSKTVSVRVLRQDGPAQQPYWERHRIAYERDMNCISVLQKMAQQATTVEGKPVSPVAWECNCLEEVCGACTMVINGRVQQACTALVDRLQEEKPDEIELQPMTKFPVLRDLVVDRRRIFAALQKVKAWVPVDSYLHLGSGPRQAPDTQELAYRYSRCMCCGCCMESCPQFLKIELPCRERETPDEYDARLRQAFLHEYIGPHAIAQVELFNSNPIGQMHVRERLDALTAEGGIQVCGNAQNCEKVCPKGVPLLTAIGRGGRAATLHMLRNWFDR